MPGDPIEISRELAALNHRLGRTFCRDMKPEKALSHPMRVLRRSMDFAIWDDVLAMEAVVGKPLLTLVPETAPMGAMRPKS